MAELAPVVVETPAGLQLAVLSGGVRMPAIPVAETVTAPIVFNTPLVVPAAPVPYVAPVYPRKQDRN